MDKNILKKFAIESRNDLMEKIKLKINTFYVDEEFSREQKGDIYILSNEKHSLGLTIDEYNKRELLIKRIKELSLEQVIEEAAYTWFNRIIAIRYMEINDMLPLTKNNASLGIRVLSSKDNTPDPEILKFTNLTNPDLDIEFKKEKYIELKDDNEKFKYILLLVCKKLGKVIPQVFDGNTDYIDILISDNLLNDAGFVTKLINDVSEENYNQVEILGWLYQYYNQTEKDRVMANKQAYKKEEIPYATQLFTPDWIVKYIVENTVCRKVNLSSEFINENAKYYISSDDEIEVSNKKLESIKILDPCCGSGHMLVYAFELLYKIYLEYGYSNGKIAEVILNNNLYGLDTDDRAEQLSVLSLLLKAREYDKNIFLKNVKLNVFSIKESNYLSSDILSEANDKDIFTYLKNAFLNAKEYGSILKISFKDYLNEINIINNTTNSLFKTLLKKEYIPVLEQANLLSQKYDIVITNPPYNAKYNNVLKKYIEYFYEISKTDMFSIFMQRGIELLNEDGLLSMINQHSWMFLQSFENLRTLIIDECSIINMVHLGANAFGQGDVGTIVQTTAFTLLKQKSNNNTHFIKLTDYNSSIEKENFYLKEKQNQINSYYMNINDFKLLPGNVFAYWLDNKFIKLFTKTKISDFSYAKAGIVTGNDEYFLKLWYEINFKNIRFNEEKFEKSMNQKWVPMNKGGLFRRYYGNNEYIMNIYDLWDENKTSKSVRRGDVESYFKKGITWSMVSGTNPSYRLSNNKVYGVASPAIYCKDVEIAYYCLGFLNTKISKILNEALNPTVNVLTGNILSLPIVISETEKNRINEIVKENINVCKIDWDSFETSWEFKKHPLVNMGISIFNSETKQKEELLEYNFSYWVKICNEKFSFLKNNEEELNKIFINIYELQDELSPKMEDKDITIRKADKVREIKSLISYAVGCMFGRYSLDEEGLIYAGGEFEEEKYKTFRVDKDNIIAITDEAYFSDDIVSKFKNFIEIVYGKDTLNTNLDFIAETLGKKGTETSEDSIRRYFNNDFYNDHIKIYQKKPIYWLFDSGKKNGFKCLIYMHRYNEGLVARVRLDYLHRIQTTYEKTLNDINYKLTTELSMNEKKEMQKRQVDLNNRLQETKEYDEKIAHIANQRINIDLDDGITINHSKFGDILSKIK